MATIRCCALWLYLAGCSASTPDQGADAGQPDSADTGDAPGTANPVPFQSCTALTATCSSNKEDCCTTTEVPGGSYFRGFDVAGDERSGDQSAPATITGFRLDKYEVTVGRFRAFVESGAGTQASPPAPDSGAHPGLAGTGWNQEWSARLVSDKTALAARVKCDPILQAWTDTAGSDESRPMNCMTWYEAAAFCIWDGGRLATEAEWNMAAAGGDQQRAYPWSDPAASTAIAPTRASYECIGDGLQGCTRSDLGTVGAKLGAGRWGHTDLAGGVWEWVLDWHRQYSPACSDCAELEAALYRSYRGGAFFSTAAELRTTNRGAGDPAGRFWWVGARCARDVK